MKFEVRVFRDCLENHIVHLKLRLWLLLLFQAGFPRTQMCLFSSSFYHFRDISRSLNK